LIHTALTLADQDGARQASYSAEISFPV
jgi:hypothetical protein